MLSQVAVVHGGYRVQDRMAQGEIGEVYKAERVVSGELCALKVLSPELMSDSLLVERFKQEVKRARAFIHPNAVRVEEAGEAEDGRPFVVMEYLPGENLRQVIAREGRFPVSRACSIARQVATVLEAAHAWGIVHQDVTPGNIMLVMSPAGPQVSLLGCCVSRIKEDHRRDVGGMTLRRTGVLMGTPEYFSPEMAVGRRGNELDGRSDLYSLGVVLYQMLCGELPFQSPDSEARSLFRVLNPAFPGTSANRVAAGLAATSGSGQSGSPTMNALLAHLLVPPKPMSRLCPDLPRELGSLVMKMLEKKPESRPANARAVVEELERVELLLLRQSSVRGRALSSSAGGGEVGPEVVPSSAPAPPEVATPPPDSQPQAAGTVLATQFHTGKPKGPVPDPPQAEAHPRRRLRRAAGAAITALSLALVAWFLTPLGSKINLYFGPPKSAPGRAFPGRTGLPGQSSEPTRTPSPQLSVPPATGSPRGTPAVSELSLQSAGATPEAQASQDQNTAGLQAAGPGKLVSEASRAGRRPSADRATLQALTSEGDGFLRRGEYDQAIQTYSRALRLDPASEALRTRILRARTAKAAEESLPK